MSSNWITDRPPTKADGDGDGEVVVRRTPGKDVGEYLHWSHVVAGVPWCHTTFWYNEGGYAASTAMHSELELVELVSDVPPVPEAPKATQPEPRRFVSISRTALATGQEIVDAIDDDGVAWELAGEEWRRIKPLPPREVSAAD